MTEKNLKNSERDLLRLFRNLGLSLPLRPSVFKVGLLHVHYLSLASWFRYLLHNSSEFLLGGFKANTYHAGVLLQSFWDAFRVDHHDHWVFQQDHLDFKKTVPFFTPGRRHRPSEERSHGLQHASRLGARHCQEVQ